MSDRSIVPEISSAAAAPIDRAVGLVRGFCLLLIHVYQRLVSPLLGPVCRFYPSCSSYAASAIERHGVWRGGALAVRRVCRCHPFNPGGVDPVPEHLPTRACAREHR